MKLAITFGLLALVLLVACSGPAKTMDPANDNVQVTNQELQNAGLGELDEVDAALAELDNLDAQLKLDDELTALDQDLQLE